MAANVAWQAAHPGAFGAVAALLAITAAASLHATVAPIGTYLPVWIALACLAVRVRSGARAWLVLGAAAALVRLVA